MDDTQQNGSGLAQARSQSDLGQYGAAAMAEQTRDAMAQIERLRAAQQYQHDQLAMASRLEALRLALGTGDGNVRATLARAKAFAAFLQTGEVA